VLVKSFVPYLLLAYMVILLSWWFSVVVIVLLSQVFSVVLGRGTDREDKYAAFLTEVSQRTGRLVAFWQNVGFVHGVLNTDNMSILGETIDYGYATSLQATLSCISPASLASSLLMFWNNVGLYTAFSTLMTCPS
jgi:hypothetical protein